MPDSHDTMPHEPLNTREREIVALLCEKLSDREIAERLFLSLNTVKWYNRQIFQKLGVESRRQAVRHAAALDVFDAGATAASKHNLPAPLTPFVGRIGELEELSRLLSADHPRLLTLLAPGGMGKTRLALALGDALLPHYPDGVWFAALAPLSSTESIVPAIIDAVHCPMLADERTPVQRLRDFLRAKRLLLIMDNCEHLLDGMAVINDLLNAAPHIRILATSRERLDLTGEMVYMLDGLRYPDAAVEAAAEYGAVQLFVQAALRANPQVAATDTEVIRICRLTQGMPLALELAAAWAGTLTASEIADEIARSADFLRTSMRDVPDRLRSIRAVFESAWVRLTDTEQHVFAALSVFRGGCTREAAQAVAGADAATLAALTARALVWRNARTGRYDVHELLRQYAGQRLGESGMADAVTAAHQAYFAAFTAQWSDGLKHDQLNALDRFDADAENVRLAYHRAIAIATPDAIMPFAGFWYYDDLRGRVSDALALTEQAIAALDGEDSVALGRLLAGSAVLHDRLENNPARVAAAEAAYEMLTRLGAERYLPLAINQHNTPFDNETRAAMLQRAHDIAVRFGDEWDAMISLYAMGTLHANQSDNAAARTYYLRVHRMAERLNNIWALSFTNYGLAIIAYEQGDDAEAERLFTLGLAAAERLGFISGVSSAYIGLAYLANKRADWLEVKQHSRPVIDIIRESGQRFGVCDQFIRYAEACIRLGEADEARAALREALTYQHDLAGAETDLFACAALIAFHDRRYDDALLLADYVLEHLTVSEHEAYALDRAHATRQTCAAAVAPAHAGEIAERAASLTAEDGLAIVSAIL